MIFIFIIIILLLISYIYYKNQYENFTSNINYVNMNNVFNNQRPLNNQKEFRIYNKGNIQINKDFYNANIEFNNTYFQNILNLFINNEKINTYFEKKKNYKYHYGKKLEIPFVNKEVYNIVKTKIVSNINDYITKFKLSNFRKFNEINNTILNYLENKEYIKFIFLLNIYRKDKYNGFQIYCVSYFNKKEKKNIIKVLKITGNIISQDIYMLPGYNPSFQNNLNIYKSCFPYTEYTASNSFLRSSENENILPSKKQVEKILNLKKKNTIHDYLQRSHNCYGSNGTDVYNCISKKNNFGLYKPPGIWDRPCYYDEDCPFYKANKNYTNNRGGCLKGICEMPLNVEKLTWRMFNKFKQPYCYNCKGKTNRCCKTQTKYNKKMLSPDYAFIGDLMERNKYKKELEEKGLKWNKMN